MQVAGHKSWFFRERSADGRVISYPEAVEGNLVLVPEGEARLRLADDYERMLSAGLLPPEAPSFDEVLAVCRTVQDRANR